MQEVHPLRKEFNPAQHFVNLYERTERELAFRASSPQEFDAWSQSLRARVTELLGGFPEHKVDLELEVVERWEFETHRMEKVIYRSDVDVWVPAYVLYPKKGDSPRPGVVALHGHGTGKVGVVGFKPDGSGPAGEEDYHKSMGVRLAERGMVVIAPEQACFGERRDEKTAAAGDPKANTCRHVSFYAQLLGKTVAGMRVWDAMRAVDVLQSLPEVDPERIGCIGISGGGTTTLFTAALDPRIKAAVIASYLNTFKESILAMRHCECNYVPGILRYAEMPDVACAIAPRAVFVEHGVHDRIFPIEATKRGVEQLKRAYALHGAEDRLGWDFFDGGHEINGKRSFDWLASQLGA